MIGGILVKLAFTSSLVAFLAYVFHLRRGMRSLLVVARATYVSSFLLIVGASAVLLSLILEHQFQYTYVWSYSSRDLPTPLLISTFYAGQEGSFMLWALFTTIIGVFLLRHSMRHDYEPHVMGIYSLIQVALLLMLLVKSPFAYVWETWAGEVKPGFMPADGRGLNPLLQNYWMVIHPQVLFSGFAAMAAPYAYAMGALLKRDYDRWFRPATPWLIFGAFILGTGIILGGFWAYETLGWGGYWAWDPVENSSFVPWLLCVAAIHMILSQRKTGAYVRTNLILGMLPFLLVLYSTFLTRSGVLGDTSVHSFVDPGTWVYLLLIALIVVFVTIPTVLFARRWKEMPRRAPAHTYYSREFALFLGSASIIFVALFVVVGTSSPIITGLLNGKKSAVDISYYSTTIVPLAIAIAVLAGIGQLVWWTKSDRGELLRSLVPPTLLAFAVGLGTVIFGVHDVRHILFITASAFALFANVQAGWRIVKGNPRYAGGAVAHVGLAVMFFGFLASSEYGSKETIPLPQGTTVTAVGYQMTYTGSRALPDERYAFDIHVEGSGTSFTLSPVMYQSKFNEGIMRHPDIVNLFSSDLYVAPLSLEAPDSTSTIAPTMGVLVQPGETRTLGELAVSVLRSPKSLVQAALDGNHAEDGVLLAVVDRNGRRTMKAAMFDQEFLIADRYRFTVSRGSAAAQVGEKESVHIEMRDLLAAQAEPAVPKKEMLVVEVSTKPLINLVWAGVVILLVGFLVAMARRAPEAT
jgi:cytochrome c-type biogenesis protein CcmF